MARWRVAVVVLLVAGSLAMARIAGMERAALTRPEIWLRDLVGSVTGGLTHLMEGSGFLIRYRSLAQDNQAMMDEVERLSSENNRLQEYRLENVRLRQLLSLKEDMPQYDLLTARVIGRDHEHWFATVTIDRGSSDGVTKNMPVIAYQGLVGRVTAVSEKTAEVLLLCDQNAAVGALIQSSRLPGVVQGTGNGSKVQMMHLPYDASVRPNQVVVTSGLGSFFPPGLRIGYIVDVVPEASGLMKRASVQAFVDFERLEEVVVIRGFGGS